jgi:hypothetical protein
MAAGVVRAPTRGVRQSGQRTCTERARTRAGHGNAPKQRYPQARRVPYN